MTVIGTMDSFIKMCGGFMEDVIPFGLDEFGFNLFARRG